MKIAISYPPLKDILGTPMIGQNRQYQVFSNPTYIYPMVPAYAATLLKQNGYEVFWDDGIAEELAYQEWLKRIIKAKPHIIAIETKTPVVMRHWKIIEELKNESLKIENWKLKIVLMGDHVTALPEESFKHCPVDYVLTGGDYDFMLLNLANHLNQGEELEAGWYFRQDARVQDTKKLQITNYNPAHSGQIYNTGKFKLNHNLDGLPMIDRKLTHWQLYAYKNGNYKYTPGSYIMSSRDCWYAGCTFCSWVTLFPRGCNRTRSVKKMLDEVGNLINLGIKEIMEDSGTLPIGSWLEEFCHGMIERGYNKKVRLSCNMRINGIKSLVTYKLMKQAGFRMVLFGLESANQKTLDKLNKGLKVEEIEPGLKLCKQAGLEPHITIMLGYPWESRQDAQRIINLAKKIFKQGIIDSLQATILIPYPGTVLYDYCQENNLLLTEDYDKFGQSQAVMKSDLDTREIKKIIQQLYKSFFTPRFFYRKIKDIRNLSDIKYYLRSGAKVMGHWLDFRLDS